MSAKTALVKKYGPLPLWAWIGAVAGGVGYRVWRSRTATTTTRSEFESFEDQSSIPVPVAVGGGGAPITIPFPVFDSRIDPFLETSVQLPPAPSPPPSPPPAPSPPPQPAPSPGGGGCAAVAAGCGNCGCLRSGSRGGRVTTLQQRLAGHGCNPGPIDGIFGPKTKGGVICLQSRSGIRADGIVGNQTFCALGGCF